MDDFSVVFLLGVELIRNIKSKQRQQQQKHLEKKNKIYEFIKTKIIYYMNTK